MEGNIYTVSELQNKRRRILDEARSGGAQIRDKDGTGLVLVQQRVFELLRWSRALLVNIMHLGVTLDRPPGERLPTDFGEFAWLAVFDEDDQQTFRQELRQAVIQSLASESVDAVEELIRDWRTTARALSNEKSRRILTSVGEPLSAFEEVGRPQMPEPVKAPAESSHRVRKGVTP